MLSERKVSWYAGFHPNVVAVFALSVYMESATENHCSTEHLSGKLLQLIKNL